MELSGKRVLITGGAVRVGAALAGGFARCGAQVVIHCRRSKEDAERLLSVLPGEGHAMVCADLAKREDAAGLLSRAGGRVDVLVNNASWYGRPGEENSLCRAVNVDAPCILMEAFARQKGLTDGVILNLLDGAALQRCPAKDAYTASRTELAVKTMEYAKRFAPAIRVNGLAPGPVLPPVWMPESRMAKVSASLPLKRPVVLSELVEAALFLCRTESATGVLLPVDCGLHLC